MPQSMMYHLTQFAKDEGIQAAFDTCDRIRSALEDIAEIGDPIEIGATRTLMTRLDDVVAELRQLSAVAKR